MSACAPGAGQPACSRAGQPLTAWAASPVLKLIGGRGVQDGMALRCSTGLNASGTGGGRSGGRRRQQGERSETAPTSHQSAAGTWPRLPSRRSASPRLGFLRTEPDRAASTARTRWWSCNPSRASWVTLRNKQAGWQFAATQQRQRRRGLAAATACASTHSPASLPDLIACAVSHRRYVEV